MGAQHLCPAHGMALESSICSRRSGRGIVRQLDTNSAANAAGSRVGCNVARPCACLRGHGVVHQSFDLCPSTVCGLAQWVNDSGQTDICGTAQLQYTEHTDSCRTRLANTVDRYAFLRKRVGGTWILRNLDRLARSCHTPLASTQTTPA